MFFLTQRSTNPTIDPREPAEPSLSLTPTGFNGNSCFMACPASAVFAGAH